MNSKKVVSFLLCLVMLSLIALTGDYTLKAAITGETKLTFSLDKNGVTINNKFSDMNAWDLNYAWTSNALGEPSNYFSANYPFVKRIQLMTATGGSTSRDLFINPNDRTTLTDYKFDTLILACRNIINKGLKPEIKTGNVPIKFSSNPSFGAFNVNVSPPDSFEQYYIYIKAIANAMVKEFGINEVKTWTWGVLTEYENGDWFKDNDGTANSTKFDYFKLYDYTVTALQEVIGASNLNVGAHGMIVASGLWNPTEFIAHCASGRNYKTGAIGAQINFLTSSYYDFKPGQLSSRTLVDCMDILRDEAAKNGIPNLKFGVDEGRLIYGADNRDLGTREVGLSYQGAADAKFFKDMIENNIDWFSTWSLNSSGLGIWDGIDTVGTHISNLGYKMVGDNYIPAAKSGTTNNPNDEIDGIGGYNSANKTAHFMLYNFNPNPNVTDSEAVSITINNALQISDNFVTVKQWYVDDSHANLNIILSI